MISRFSSSGIWSASVTWRSQDLPKMVATGVPARRSPCRPGSFAQETPGLRVALKAASFERRRRSFSAALKNCRSLGLEPG
jgi:hypothetical protein